MAAGLGRYVRVLQLFSETRGTWTIAAMSDALALPPSTVYRAVKELIGTGFIEAADEAQYRLGPTFMEYDRLIRVTDPLYAAGLPVLRDAVTAARVPCVAILARLYNGTVMCIADAAAPGAGVKTSYERGRPRPLSRGATSKVILAQLPPRKLARLLPPAHDGEDRALAQELAAIRKRGFSITRGEVDAGLVGIAAPIAVPSRGLIGSLSLVLDARDLTFASERRLAMLVMSTAGLLVEELDTPPPTKAAAVPRRSA